MVGEIGIDQEASAKREAGGAAPLASGDVRVLRTQIHPGPYTGKPYMTGLSCIWGLRSRHVMEYCGNKDGNGPRLPRFRFIECETIEL